MVAENPLSPPLPAAQGGSQRPPALTIFPVGEPSHAERMPPRVELSAQELTLLLGADRFDRPSALPSQELLAAAARAPAPLAADTPGVPGSFDAPEPAPSHDAVQPPTGSTRSLGDVDLVGAIIDGAPNFEALALRVLRERTGEPLARIVDGAVADAMLAAGTASPLDEGRALVAPLSPDVRAAWAQWLARWLHLATLAAMRAPRGAWDDPTGLPTWERVRAHTAHRIATARMRREPVHVAILRVEDTDLWNRRAQVLVNDAFQARIATELDQHVAPGDELSRLEDGAFALVTSREQAPQALAAALRNVIAQLPGDGPRSLAVHLGMATAPWEATCPQTLLQIALRRAAEPQS